MIQLSSGHVAGKLSGTLLRISTNRVQLFDSQWRKSQKETSPFLDTVFERRGTIATTAVYWKPTHTDKLLVHYFQFTSRSEGIEGDCAMLEGQGSQHLL